MSIAAFSDRRAIEYIEASAFIVVSIVLEAGGAILLRFARERSSGWYLSAYAMYAASLGLFPLTLDVIPLYVAYAVWAGCGCVLTTLAGILWFGETLTNTRLLSLCALVAGVVGLVS